LEFICYIIGIKVWKTQEGNSIYSSDDFWRKKSCQEFSEAIGNNSELKYEAVFYM
jgi:hypothetical protein